MDEPRLLLTVVGTVFSFTRIRDFVHEDEEYDEDDEDLDEEDDRMANDSRAGTELEDRLMVFGDSACNYATSLDYRNTIDLREIGVESKRDTLLDLKSGQAAVSSSFRLLQTKLNIAGSMAHSRNNMVADHHRHYHHHQLQQQQQQQQQQQHQHQQQHQLHGYEQHEQHHRQGWSNEECFNFRFTDKSQSAPSLPSSVDESAHGGPRSFTSFPSSSRVACFVSTSSLFENYTRVASVPVDLNLCGVHATNDDTRRSPVSSHEHHEMAEAASVVQGNKKRLESAEEIRQNGGGEEGEAQAKSSTLTSSVRTQASQNLAERRMVDGKMESEKAEEQRKKDEECVGGEHCSKPRERKQLISTVKTQDRGNCVLDMAIVMENDIDSVDAAIKQLKREVDEVTSNSSSVDSGIQRTPSGRQRPWKMKNNASYELAQQFEVDERNFRPSRHRKNVVGNDGGEKPLRSGRKRVLNNASYELAQQCDYINALQSSRGAFKRMDACDELEESISGRSSRLKVSDFVQQMSSSSTSNLPSYNEPYVDLRRYSKSTENLSTQFSIAPFTRVPINQLGQRLKKQEEETLFSQIKKNSDPFSAYGDDSNVRAFVDEEIDLPCLETKPIGTSSLEGGVLRERERTSAQKPQVSLTPNECKIVDSYASHKAAIITDAVTRDGDGDGDAANETSCSKRSFIGDFYPEKILRLQRQKEDRDAVELEVVAGSGSKNESSSSIRSSSSSSSSSSTFNGDRNVGELLWRVIVEKQAAEKEEEKVTKEKEEKQEEEKNEREQEAWEKEEAGTEAARGHTVHGVRCPPLGSSSSNSDGLEPSERSGNPAVAVAVDTNHRGDRDKRHEENAAATTTTAPVRVDERHDGHATMSATTTTTKPRPFVAAPVSKNEPSAARFQRNMVVDASTVTTVKEERKKGGLGGFLQRFSRLRFSGRSKVPRSEVQKKSDTIGQVNRAKVTEQKVKKEPDYIIIPLHPPEEERQRQTEQNAAAERRADTGNDRTVQPSSSIIRLVF